MSAKEHWLGNDLTIGWPDFCAKAISIYPDESERACQNVTDRLYYYNAVKAILSGSMDKKTFLYNSELLLPASDRTFFGVRFGTVIRPITSPLWQRKLVRSDLTDGPLPKFFTGTFLDLS
jgi:hypothetical protein